MVFFQQQEFSIHALQVSEHCPEEILSGVLELRNATLPPPLSDGFLCACILDLAVGGRPGAAPSNYSMKLRRSRWDERRVGH